MEDREPDPNRRRSGERPGETTGSAASEPPAEGLIRIRRGLAGIGFVWLTAVAAFGAVGAALYGVTTPSGYLPPLAAVLAAGIAVGAGLASLRTFGYR